MSESRYASPLMLTTLIFAAFSLDQALAAWVALYGAWALLIIALLIFAETGLVVFPFLPGDTLLFLSGTVFAAAGFNIHLSFAVLAAAAILGDATNFAVGHFFAPRVIERLHGRWLKPEHLDATRRYFDRYGPSTIVVARFVPVVRTLAPFLAGAGEMHYARFAAYNVVGGLLWVGAFLYGGALLGSQPFVRAHLPWLTAGAVAVSLLPLGLNWWRQRRAAREPGASP